MVDSGKQIHHNTRATRREFWAKRYQNRIGHIFGFWNPNGVVAACAQTDPVAPRAFPPKRQPNLPVLGCPRILQPRSAPRVYSSELIIDDPRKMERTRPFINRRHRFIGGVESSSVCIINFQTIHSDPMVGDIVYWHEPTGT